MGQRMPDEPIEYGDQDCTIWDPDETPKYLYIRFSLIEKCPAAAEMPPNDRCFKLTQVIDHPCYYRFDDATWGIGVDLNAAPDPTDILLMDKAGPEAYFSEDHPQVIVEGRVYHNDYAACPLGRGGKNGICVITWSPQATKLLEDIVIGKGDDLFMELRPLANGNLVYKFCRIAESTNIKILFELP